MSFSKVKTNGWITNEKLLHTQLNQLDTDHANAIDKTGETVALGGGVTGEIEFKSASSAVFDSGSTLNVKSGGQSTLDGFLNVQTRVVSGTYTIDSSGSDNTILVNTSAARSLTLPLPTAGRVLTIKDQTGSAQTNNITLNPHASETINGLSGAQLLNVNYGYWNLISDGTNWFYTSQSNPIPAHTWVTNLTGSWAGVGTNLIVVSAFVTPRVSGKFRIILTGTMYNNTNTYITTQPCWVSHGTSATNPVDFFCNTTYFPNYTAVAGTTITYGNISRTCDLSLLATPIVFTVGTPVQFNVVLAPYIGAPGFLNAGDLQLDVQEINE